MRAHFTDAKILQRAKIRQANALKNNYKYILFFNNCIIFAIDILNGLGGTTYGNNLLP